MVSRMSGKSMVSREYGDMGISIWKGGYEDFDGKIAGTFLEIG